MVPVCRRAHEGAQPRGPGACRPRAEEAPRAGPEALGADAPLGGLLIPCPTTRARGGYMPGP